MLEQYQLIDRIGVGGMAEVWRATMRGAAGFERQVAIKRILPNFSGDSDFVAMFIDEAKIAVRLSHPNIVQIFDLGRAGDEWFIAMEFVAGKDVRAVMDAEAARGQRVPLEVACHVVMKMCEALHHAHFLDANPLDPTASKQIIHRDVSPQNVLVSYEGEVKVTDFGLAKAAGRAAHTQAGTIKGKLAYMSPEQLRGMPLDQRSDVFAVGIVLWELLSGERLFLGKNDRDTIAKAFACKVPSLVEIDPSIDPELDRIARMALAQDRNQRYQTAQDLHEELEAFVYGSGLSLSTGSLSAYMRALFPQAEVSRRRDPRAVTAQLELPDAGEALDELEELEEAELMESEPAPRMRSQVPASSIPIEDAELSDHDIDALDQSLQTILGEQGSPAERSASAKAALSAPRLPSIPAASPVTPPSRASYPPIGADEDFGNATIMSDPDAGFPELEAARRAFEEAQRRGAQTAAPAARAPKEAASATPAPEHPFADDEVGFDHPSFDDGTISIGGAARPPIAAQFDEHEATPEFDVGLAREAAQAVERTHDDPDATHMPSDDEAYAALAAENPPEDLVVTRMVGPSPTDIARSRQADRTGSATLPKDERRAYEGFEEDEETTTGTGRRR